MKLKGLEFDDVILYDFFTQSSCEGQWRIINDISVKNRYVSLIFIQIETHQKVEIQENLTINELDSDNYNKFIQKLRNEEYKGDGSDRIRGDHLPKHYQRQRRSDSKLQHALC